MPRRRSASKRGRGIQSSSASGCEISISRSLRPFEPPESACPTAFRLRIHPLESERRYPTADAAAKRLPNRRKPRADDNCPGAGAKRDACRSPLAAAQPARLPAPRKEAADSHYQTAEAFHANGENQN